MIVPKEDIKKCKDLLGEEAAQIIANDLCLENYDKNSMKSSCPFHKDKTPSFIYDKNNNCFHCFSCGKNYGILDHYMNHYKLTFMESIKMLFDIVGYKFSFENPQLNIKRDYLYPEYKVAEDKDKITKYFATRCISKETLDYCDVEQEYDTGNIMWNFYDENDILLTVKCRLPRKDAKPKEWFIPNFDHSNILFNMNRIDPSKPLVITEGQMDCLAVIESGYSNTVSVPAGTENLKWIEECYEWLEQFDKIIIWSDNDRAGLNLRKEACSRLGSWRTKYVDLPVELEKENNSKVKVKDANEVLYHFGKQKVLDFIENAQELPLPNVIDLADAEDFDIETAQGLYAGLKPLDDTVYKFVFGSVVVLTGTRGSGKSTLLNQVFICEALHQGHDVFVFSGELSNPVLKSWVETSMAGTEKIKMKNDFVRIIEPETKKLMRDWYRGRILTFDDISNNAEMILDRATNVIRRFGTKIVILDNLMCLDIGATTENNVWQKQKEFMVKLVNLAKTYNILVVLVSHPRKTSEVRRLTADDVAGSSDITNIVQYLLGVHRYSKSEKEGEMDNKGNYRKGHEPIEEDVAVDIFKNRYTGKLSESRLFFDYPSMRFYSTAEELYRRYGWNTDTTTIPNKTPNKEDVNNPDWYKD